MKKNFLVICLSLLCLSFQSCVRCNRSTHRSYGIIPEAASSSSNHNADSVAKTSDSSLEENAVGGRSVDKNVSNSMEREQSLRDAGMDRAANIERNARRKYNQGGGYTSKDGGRQVHYNGSREQQNDLRMIDEYFGF